MGFQNLLFQPHVLKSKQAAGVGKHNLGGLWVSTGRTPEYPLGEQVLDSVMRSLCEMREVSVLWLANAGFPIYLTRGIH